MSAATETMLADWRVGRILLHLLAMKVDHAVRFHMAGIGREFKKHTQ